MVSSNENKKKKPFTIKQKERRDGQWLRKWRGWFYFFSGLFLDSAKFLELLSKMVAFVVTFFLLLAAYAGARENGEIPFWEVYHIWISVRRSNRQIPLMSWRQHFLAAASVGKMGNGLKASGRANLTSPKPRHHRLAARITPHTSQGGQHFSKCFSAVFIFLFWRKQTLTLLWHFGRFGVIISIFSTVGKDFFGRSFFVFA